MGIGIFLIIAVLVLLASFLYHTDMNRLNKDYEDWKNNRR